MADALIRFERLRVGVQALIGASPGEGDQDRIGAGMLGLIVVQTFQGGLIGVGAGDVLGQWKAVGVAGFDPLKLGRDLEQVFLGFVLRVAIRGGVFRQAGDGLTNGGRGGSGRAGGDGLRAKKRTARDQRQAAHHNKSGQQRVSHSASD